MTTTQNVKQFNDLENPVRKGMMSAAASQQTLQDAHNDEWDSVAALNECLAYSIELSSRIKQAHWGAKGESFYVFHKMAEDFTVQLAKQSNKISARIVAIEGVPAWTPQKVAKASRMPDYPGNLFKLADHIEALTGDYTYAIEKVKPLINKAAKSNDFVTVSVFTSLQKELDEQKAFLLAHSGIAWLEKPKKKYA
jgi:starvation-inducible DNA-binding protein